MKKIPIEIIYDDACVKFECMREFAQHLGVVITRAKALLKGKTQISAAEYEEILKASFELPAKGKNGNQHAKK